jgi:hypothetical protein
MSGRVRDAFRKKGHEAYSVDLLPGIVGSDYHWIGDARDFLDRDWDLLIAHPPCTYLCNSGVRWLHERPERWDDLKSARALFMSFWESPIPRIAVENPVPHKYAQLPEYTQTIQPYQFGEDASKRTCLWLKGLTLLQPTLIIPPTHGGANGKYYYGNQTPSGQNKEGPSSERGALRSLTYPGIAEAFAGQWG